MSRSTKKPFDIDGFMEAKEPLPPLPIAQRIQAAPKRPLASLSYLAAFLEGAKAFPIQFNEPGLEFICPICSERAEARPGSSREGLLKLSCKRCESVDLRRALIKLAPLAFEAREDLLYPFPSDLEQRFLSEPLRRQMKLDHREATKALDRVQAVGTNDIYRYTDPSGGTTMLVIRHDYEGRKTFRPFHIAVDASDRITIELGFPEGLYPLFNWYELDQRKDATVLVVEGERAATAAAELFPEMVVTTSACGANSAGKTDWGTLRDRDVVIWPDNDVDGEAYALAAAAHALSGGARSARRVTLPAGLPPKWDLADPLPDAVAMSDLSHAIAVAVALKWEDVKGAVVDQGAARTIPPFRLPDGHFQHQKKMLESVEAALEHMNSGCRRGRWLGVLGAIFHAFGEAGYEIADEWSRRGSEQHKKYVAHEVRNLWDRWLVAPIPQPMPLLAVFRMAMKESKLNEDTKVKKDSWKPDEIPIALAHIAEFESRHRKVIRGDNVQIAIQEIDDCGEYRIRFMSEKNAASIYKSIKAPDFEGNTVGIYPLWENHQLHPPVKLVFRPGQQAGSDEHNLFVGFDIEPRKNAGHYSTFMEHLEYVMDSNGDTDRFLLKLMAYRFQNLNGFVPSTPVFVGPQGSGKSSITRVLAHLLAPYSITLSDPEKFVGKNNACLQGKLFVQAEEMNLSYPEARHHRLLHFITADMLDVEDKFMAQFQVENRLFTAITSNDRNCVRISEDSRRFAMYEIVDRFEGDQQRREEFFGRMWNELKNGGLETLAYDLLHMDLTGFSPMSVPKTKLFNELAGDNADRDPLRMWWKEVLERGVLAIADGASKEWSAPILKDSLYAEYVGWCEGDGPRSKAAIKSHGEWAKRLGQMVPGGLVSKRTMVGGQRKQYFIMPPYEECCVFFEQRFRQTIDRAPEPGQLRAVM